MSGKRPTAPSLIREAIILPRKRGYTHLPVIASTHGFAIDETGAEVDIVERALDYRHPAIWITDDANELLATLHNYGRRDPLWRFQATGSERSQRREIGETAEAKVSLRRFTFEPPDDKGRRHHRMHLVHVAPEIIGGDLFSLLRYGKSMIAWCADNDLPIPTSLTGMSASLLRDSRFWPNPRGRVPRATNDKVRPHLPGVYSESGSTTAFHRNATAVDLTSAYHAAARTTPTPDSDNLYAWGYFNDPMKGDIWIDKNDPGFEDSLSEHGLFALRISTRARNERWLLPALRSTTPVIYLWSSELMEARRQGLVIEGVVAGWTSPEADQGLVRYAKWAQEELRAHPEHKWLKVALLAAYGLLGAQTQDIVSHIGPRGLSKSYIGPRVYTGRVFTLRNVSSPTVNVAALGVIQAQIRTTMLALAREFEDTGHTVSHVHADSLHISGERLPLLDERLHATPLSHLFYVDDHSWISDQAEHLPGRHGARRAYEHRKRIKAIERKLTSAKEKVSQCP